MSFAQSIKQKWINLDEAWRFAITAFLIARIFYAIWSWVVLTIQPVAVHYVEIAGKPGVTFLNLYTVKAYTYVREVDGNSLTFRPINKDTVTDLQTGSLWNIYSGEGTQGKYQGIKLSPGSLPSDMFPYLSTKPYPNAWLALWQRFDANWYTSIAERGYGNISGDLAFPPLFPLLIRLLMPIFGNAFIAGLIVSHACTLYALKLLYDLFATWGNSKSAQWSVIFMLIYPTSFFLFSAYTEPLFLALALLSMRSMKNRSWPYAGFWIFCAFLARLQGIALFLPMLYLMWKDKPFLLKLEHWASGVIALSGPLFYLYFRSNYIQKSAAIFSDQAWHSHLTFPWAAYVDAIRILLLGKSNYIDILNFLITTIFAVLIITAWKKISLEYNLYSLVSLLVMLTRVVDEKPLNAMLRYSLTLFPSFYIIGLAGENPWKRRIIIYTFIALNLYLSSEFFSWGWVA
jgi:hypothetical protein